MSLADERSVRHRLMGRNPTSGVRGPTPTRFGGLQPSPLDGVQGRTSYFVLCGHHRPAYVENLVSLVNAFKIRFRRACNRWSGSGIDLRTGKPHLSRSPRQRGRSWPSHRSIGAPTTCNPRSPTTVPSTPLPTRSLPWANRHHTSPGFPAPTQAEAKGPCGRVGCWVNYPIATTGEFRWVPPSDPSKAASPKAKIPPSEATSQ
jgi:hypothetical protein